MTCDPQKPDVDWCKRERGRNGQWERKREVYKRKYQNFRQIALLLLFISSLLWKLRNLSVFCSQLGLDAGQNVQSTVSM